MDVEKLEAALAAGDDAYLTAPDATALRVAMQTAIQHYAAALQSPPPVERVPAATKISMVDLGSLISIAEEHAPIYGALIDRSREALATPVASPLREVDTCLSDAEKKEQANRCTCRGSDDYCPCQNAPDAVTRRKRPASPDSTKATGEAG